MAPFIHIPSPEPAILLMEEIPRGVALVKILEWMVNTGDPTSARKKNENQAVVSSEYI